MNEVDPEVDLGRPLDKIVSLHVKCQEVDPELDGGRPLVK